MTAWLNQRQAAEYVGLSPDTLQRMRTTGRGPRYHVVGRRFVRYDPVDLEAWMRGKPHLSTSEYKKGEK